ncbi:MAG: hypothetical protein Q9195_007974 [Heterodermia aff. obscurata]
MAPPAATRNFQQHQPITTALRQICESYPAGTCLRELLQNADDAEATEIEYVLDTKSYNEAPLLYEGLQDFQGPALLARNNKTFSDRDFASLSSIGDSRKRHDLAATDGPWIYSRQWLLLLDPHESWSVPTGQVGGPAWDVVHEKDSVELRNHLKTFDAFALDVSKPLDGTIIRIPLRTKAQAEQSKIVQKEVTVSDIESALAALGREVREGGLLFLKHVRRMLVRIDEAIMWEVNLDERYDDKRSVRSELTADFKAIFMPSKPTSGPSEISKSFILDMSFKEAGKETTTTPYLVHHSMYKSSGSDELDSWARSKKLFSWVAVGAPLKESSLDEPFNGRLFSILRMPLETNQPVHVHGLFSITPDRGRLSSSGQTPGYEDMEVKWNTYIFEHCVANAWAALLQTRNTTSWREEGFSLWPRVEDAPTEIWTKLDGFLLHKILSADLKVWNTAHGCVSASEGLFANSEDQVALTYAPVLENVKLPAVVLKPSLLRKAIKTAEQAKRPLQHITPSAVRSHLRTNISAIPDRVPPLVLEYCLYDAINDRPANHVRHAIYDSMKSIPLWPTVGGNLKSFADCTLILPRNNEELTLFEPSRPESTLNSRNITEPVKARILQDVSSRLLANVKLRTLGDLKIDWPNVYQISNVPLLSNDLSQLRETEYDETLKRVWTWIESRYQEEKTFPEAISELWLLPIEGNLIRRCMPGLDRQPMLIAEESDELHEILSAHRSTVKAYTESAQMLDCSAISQKAVQLIRVQASTIPAFSATSAGDALSLIHWLATNVELVWLISEPEKLATVLQKLVEKRIKGRLKAIDSTTLSRTANELRKLPLFTRQYANPPYKHWLSSIGDLSGDPLRIQIPQDLPAICPIPGINFYRSTHKSENDLINTFILLKQINTEGLLFEYLLPYVFSKQPVHSVEEVKYSLADFTMKKARYQERFWISKIDKFAIIPLKIGDTGKARAYRRIMALVDPESSLAKLFFPDEEVFPETQFFENHRTALRANGLQRAINLDIVIERIRCFAQRQNSEELLKRVRRLINSPIDVGILENKNIVTEIRTSNWLPTTSPSGQLVNCSPLQSRAIEDSELCNHVLNVLDSKVHHDWKLILGWDAVVEEKVLLDQLDACRKSFDHSQVDQVLGYHYKKYGASSIGSKPYIRTARQIYVEPSQAVLPGGLQDKFPLTPFLETVDRSFAEKHTQLLSDMKIKANPTFDDLIKVQQAMIDTNNGVALQAEQLNVSRNLLEIASQIFSPEQLGSFRVPDHEGRLALLTDIVYGDPSVTIKDVEIRYTHPDISSGLISRLGIESVGERATRLQIAIEDEDDDEYVPREELSTIISDTLRRYPIMATFSEFLANAEDCEASKISWILDVCQQGPYSGQRLMTSELVDLQGAALFSHNDQIFTAKDFEGYKDIGRGGKQGDATTIGMFGRGSMSMYHFTDNPMILSGDAMVILDPQQRLLPKNNKSRRRKLGVKLSLDTFKHNYPDQLLPFHGLCSYDKDMSFYQGTLFRMPLNRPTPTRSSMSVFEIQKLLDEYCATARESLLFLENVRSIDFSLRSQSAPRWTVTAEHSNNFSEGVHQQIRLCGQETDNTKFEETWHVGLTDIEKVPAEVPIPNVGKTKLIECGVAACVRNMSPEGESALSPRMPARRLYSKLPTTYETGLPVALNATFAMTGDRRSITIDESREEGSRWNHWLLETCLPDMYIELLKYLAPIVGAQVFDFWPHTRAHVDPLSNLIQTSFWEKIVLPQYSQYPVYPVSDAAISSGNAKTLKSRKSGARKLHPVVSLESAEFDLMPIGVSNLLRPFIGSLCPQLVRPPTKLRHMLGTKKPNYVTVIDSNHLSTFFKKPEGLTCLISFLQTFEEPKKSKVLEVILLEIVPELVEGGENKLHILDGCRLLPRSDESMSTLKIMDPNESTSTIDWALLPSSEERSIFGFAKASLVAPGLLSGLTANEYVRPEFLGRNPIQDLMDSSFNIRHIENYDMKQLLTQKGSPLASPNHSSPDETWFSQLWIYLRRKLIFSGDQSAKCTTVFDLGDCPIYRCFDGDKWQYLTPNEFEGGAFLLKPSVEEEVILCKELKLLGLIDRDHVEPVLATEESSLKDEKSFRRMARALRRVRSKGDLSVDVLLRNRLSKTSVAAFRNRLLHHATIKHAPEDRELFRSLPLWPCQSPTSEVQFIGARDALFCSQEPLVAWVACVQGPNNFVDARFVKTHESSLTKLGFQLMNASTIFDEFIQKNLPQSLTENQSRHFSSMIECLGRNKIGTQSNIVPNGHGVLCKAEALYDHNDPMFQAAFRQPLEDLNYFVKGTFRGLRDYWVFIGLRKQLSSNVYLPADYLACVRAMTARLNRSPIDNRFNSDVEKVAGYLSYDQPCLHSWQSNVWDEISKARIFTVQMGFPQDGTYRQARVREIAHRSSHCSIQQSGRRNSRRVLWSQLPSLSNPPADYVYTQLPAGGNPDVSIVYKHLLFLMEIHTSVLQADIVEFLKDVRSCYNLLQSNATQISQTAGIRQAAIWFNLDTTELETVTPEQLAASVIPTSRLCINAVAEPYPFKNTRKFLTPYEKLLKALDVQAVITPEIDIPTESDPSDSPADFLAASYRQLRAQRQLLDVVFVAEGKSVEAHKLPLAAVSAYCKAQFSGEWGAQLLASNNTITLDIKHASLVRMVDFAYHGTVHWPPLSGGTNDEVADRLDEVLDLLQCADMWLMERLHAVTERYLLRNFRTLVRIDNVVEVREEALRARAGRVVRECEVFGERNRGFVRLFREGGLGGGV